MHAALQNSCSLCSKSGSHDAATAVLVSQVGAALSCMQLKTDYPDLPTATYWLDPNGGDSGDAFQRECEMTQDGGGWDIVNDEQRVFVETRHTLRAHRFDVSSYGYNNNVWRFEQVFTDYHFAGELDDGNNFINSYFNGNRVSRWANNQCNVGAVRPAGWPRLDTINSVSFEMSAQPEGDVDADCGNGQRHGTNWFKLARFRVEAQ